MTPRFTLRQDDDFLYAEINVPYVRVSDMEIVLSGTLLAVWCKPFLLRLTLPGEVVDDERAKAVYDVDDVRARGGL